LHLEQRLVEDAGLARRPELGAAQCPHRGNAGLAPGAALNQALHRCQRVEAVRVQPAAADLRTRRR
jgi:hypothetical protein